MGYSNVAGDLNVAGTTTLSTLTMNGPITTAQGITSTGVSNFANLFASNLTVTNAFIVTATNTQLTNSLSIVNQGTATALYVNQNEFPNMVYNVAEFWDHTQIAMVIDGYGNVAIHQASSPGYALTVVDGALIDKLTLGTPLSISSGGTGTASGAPPNQVFAGPSIGSAGPPLFRALVNDDLPSIISVSNVSANGSGLSTLNSSNLVGNVANANVALVVSQASQPNITSVGLLTNLAVSNSLTTSNLFLSGTANISVANIANIYTTNIVGFIGSQWTTGTENVYYLSNVGIGTSLVSSTLTVAGNVYVSNSVTTTNLVASVANVGTLNVGTISNLSTLAVTTANVGTLNVIQVSNLSSLTTNLVASVANVGTLNVISVANLASLSLSNNLYAANALTTTNMFANTLTLANATSTINVIGNVVATTFWGAHAGSNTGSFSNLSASNGVAISNLSASNVNYGTLSTSVFPTSGVTAGTYGSGANVAQVTIDTYGRVTDAANVSITSSQWTTGTGNIYYLSNVGIGTSSVSANLTVAGNVYVSNAIDTTNIQVSGNVSTHGFLIDGAIGQVGYVPTSQGDGSIQWALPGGGVWVPGTGNTYYVGNVGIGTSAVSANLTVIGNTYVSNALNTTNVFATGNTSTAGFLIQNAPGQIGQVITATGSGAGIQWSSIGMSPSQGYLLTLPTNYSLGAAFTTGTGSPVIQGFHVNLGSFTAEVGQVITSFSISSGFIQFNSTGLYQLTCVFAADQPVSKVGVGTTSSSTWPPTVNPVSGYTYVYNVPVGASPAELCTIPLNVTDASLYYFIDAFFVSGATVLYPTRTVSAANTNYGTFVQVAPFGTYLASASGVASGILASCPTSQANLSSVYSTSTYKVSLNSTDGWAVNGVSASAFITPNGNFQVNQSGIYEIDVCLNPVGQTPSQLRVGSFANDSYVPNTTTPLYIYTYAPQTPQDPTTSVTIPLSIQNISNVFFLEVTFSGTVTGNVALDTQSTYVMLKPIGSFYSPLIFPTNTWSQQGSSIYYSYNVGIGTNATPASLTIAGNVYASNALTGVNALLSGTMNVQGVSNLQSLVTPTANVGTLNTASLTTNLVATTANVTTLNVISVANLASLTTNLVATTANVTTLNALTIAFATANITTLNVATIPSLTTPLANVTTANLFVSNVTTLNVSSNIFTPAFSANATNTVFNFDTLTIPYASISSINVASTLNVQGVANVTTLNVTSLALASSISISSINVASTLNVQGVANVSNLAATTVYYNEDITRRSPHIQPTTANASAIQGWISWQSNIVSQQSSFWAPASRPIFSNIASGPPSSNAYAGSVAMADGRTLFIPYGASTFGVFNSATNQYSAITPSGAALTPTSGWGNGLYFGGVQAPSGNIVCIPHASGNIGVFEPEGGTFSNILVHNCPSGAFAGGVLDGSSNVTMIPYNSLNVCTYNGSTGLFSNMVQISSTPPLLVGGVLLSTGNILGIPFGSSNLIQYSPTTRTFANITVGLGGFFGGVLTPNGNVVCVPYTAANVVVVNPTTRVASNIVTGASGFMGGILLPNGQVALVPGINSNVGLLNTVTFTLSNITPQGGSISNAYVGASLTVDGRVVFCPNQSTNVAVLNSVTPLPSPEYRLVPYVNKL